jgi:ABC-type dipeptide/oligopeptide/nickel transport system permease component
LRITSGPSAFLPDRVILRGVGDGMTTARAVAALWRALGWYFAASLLRLTRSSMLEVLRSEYIKLARLKGLPGYVVIAVHAFKNALIPVLTLAGINLVVMLTPR